MSVTVASTVLLLAIHPEFQQRCYEELTKVIPEKGTEITREHLDAMHYTEQCINETLRLLPTVALIGRTTDSPIELKSITVPAGMSIIIAMRQIMRKNEYWGDDAKQFNPDHFSAENVAKRHPYAYIPFSEGLRNCVGMRKKYLDC